MFLCFAYLWANCRHCRFVWKASRELKSLSKLTDVSQKISYLRRVNPFVFEEMILTACKRKGWKIKRNKRYTGDGGIDGMVRIDGQWYVIQAKRYKGYINAKDVTALKWICRKRKVGGLFIHTGKAGSKSMLIAEQTQGIHIVGGSEMLDLLAPVT